MPRRNEVRIKDKILNMSGFFAQSGGRWHAFRMCERQDGRDLTGSQIGARLPLLGQYETEVAACLRNC